MTIRHHFELRETIATILADEELVIETACEGIRTARYELERYIIQDPFFNSSFEPLTITHGPEIIRNMAAAAWKAGVGPMAAVAGAVAHAGVSAAQREGASFCIIDNGGDIAMITDRPVRWACMREILHYLANMHFLSHLKMRYTGYAPHQQRLVIPFHLERQTA